MLGRLVPHFFDRSILTAPLAWLAVLVRQWRDILEVQSGNLCRFAENGSSAEDIVLVQGRKGGLFTFTGLWIVTLSEVEANAGQRGILLEPGVEPTVTPHLGGMS